LFNFISVLSNLQKTLTKLFSNKNLARLGRASIFTILFLSLVGCGANKKDNYKGMDAAAIYNQAQKNVAKNNFVQAVKDFEALEARFPYGEYSDKAELGLINAYYQKNEPAMALAAADRFIRMHPRHPEAAYVFYLKGLISYEQNTTFMYRHLPLDRSARDPSPAQDSFDAFRELLDHYPDSKYASEARQRMIFLKDQLANHEIAVIEYYMKRGAYLAAANRANYVIKNFERTTAVPKALSYLAKSYQKLGMKDLEEQALHTIEKNFPESQN
jgi:outer membrane protein assembly factor BamD